MKNYKEITNRYLKQNIKRTLLTIFGIILSVSLITAISTIIGSVREGIKTEEIENRGAFHGIYRGVEGDKIEKLSQDKRVAKLGIEKYLGSIPITETNDLDNQYFGGYTPYKYIELKAMDKNARELQSIKLTEGRLPENQKEIIIEEDAFNKMEKPVELGDKLEFKIGERRGKEEGDLYIEEFLDKDSQEYTVVGKISAKQKWNRKISFVGITGIDKMDRTGKYDVVLSLENIKDAYQQLESLKNVAQVEDLEAHERLLRLYVEGISETFNTSMLLMLALIMAIIVVSTIAVIYNSFNISVIERIEQFGLLRSIGATPGQIRRLVYREAGLLSLIGIPLGHIAGVLAMKIVFLIIGKMSIGAEIVQFIDIKVFPQVIVFSTILGAVTIFLSARGPATKAGQISPLEAIRGNSIVKQEKIKKKRTIGLIRLIFGIEGEIAYKNLARNKKRFLITVFSMSISIMLFITFSSFAQMGFTTIGKHDQDMGDIAISGEIEEVDQLVDDLKKVEGVKSVYNFRQDYGQIDFEKDRVNPSYLKEEENQSLAISEEGKVLNNIELITIGDKDLKDLEKHLKTGEIDIEKMNRENGVLVINTTSFNTQKGDKLFKDAFKYKIGDTVDFVEYNHEDKAKQTRLKVVGSLDQGLLSYKYNRHGAVSFYTTEEVMEKVKGEELTSNIFIFLEENADKKPIRSYLKELEEKNEYYNIVDYAEEAQNARQFMIIMSIFLYGFVVVISLISAINIINTISTNIILRTKEIGTIKAIGMSQKAVKKMISLESIYYGIYSTIIGGSLGLLFTRLFHNLFVGVTDFNYVWPVKNILIASFGAIIISILAGKYPLRKINHKLIVESIKEDN